MELQDVVNGLLSDISLKDMALDNLLSFIALNKLFHFTISADPCSENHWHKPFR